MMLFYGASLCGRCPRSRAYNLNDVANEAAAGAVSKAERLNGASDAFIS